MARRRAADPRLGDGLTAEAVRAAMQAVCDEHGCDLPDDVIVSPRRRRRAVGHEPGHGAIGAGERVVVDIWPRDRASRCWADMTRTFVAGGGEPGRGARRATGGSPASRSSRVYPMVRAGADCRAIYEASCEPFNDAGLPTQLTKEPGTVLEDGYFHGLGHGVGLEVHERPNLGRNADTLLAGDVITLEPGLLPARASAASGSRISCVVTEDGCETLDGFSVRPLIVRSGA